MQPSVASHRRFDRMLRQSLRWQGCQLDAKHSHLQSSKEAAWSVRIGDYRGRRGYTHLEAPHTIAGPLMLVITDEQGATFQTRSGIQLTYDSQAAE